MKTIEKTIKIPKLSIEHDDSPVSPRIWSNLGYFITVDRNYHSPDRDDTIEYIVKSTSEVADNAEDHMKRIKAEFKEQLDEKVLAIYPINKYEHSGVVYRLGEAHGWDYSNNGFYIVTDKTAKELGTKAKDYEKVIKQELEVYNKYTNGEVYGFILYGDNGEIEDS